MALVDLPYLHAAGDGGPRARTQVVVIHATDNTASASAEANYATRRPDKTSAHFYVDDTSAYRALPLDNIAYGCLWHGNQVSVQLELCGRSGQLSEATWRRAAGIVAEVCAHYGIPVRKLTAAEVRAGARGVCGHADVTAAWPEDGGDHTDPGAFPWAQFITAAAGGGSMSSGILVAGEPLEQYLVRIERALWWPIPGIAQTVTATKTTLDAVKASIATVQSAGAPSDAQVNAAVLAAMRDPEVLKGIGAAIAAHLKVV